MQHELEQLSKIALVGCENKFLCLLVTNKLLKSKLWVLESVLNRIYFILCNDIDTVYYLLFCQKRFRLLIGVPNIFWRRETLRTCTVLRFRFRFSPEPQLSPPRSELLIEIPYIIYIIIQFVYESIIILLHFTFSILFFFFNRNCCHHRRSR